MTPEMGRFFPGPCSCRSSLPLRFQWEGLKGLWVQSPGLWVGICEPTLFPVGWLLWPEPLPVCVGGCAGCCGLSSPR